LNKVKAAIVEFPGSFSVAEVETFCQQLGVDSLRVWFDEEKLPDVDFVILPSGDSFADYIRPGALAARTKAAGAIKAFARAGGNVIGIGNGFQTLCELGLLPGMLLQNNDCLFKNTSVHLLNEGNENFFFGQLEKDLTVQVPFTGKYGSFYANKRTIQDIEEQKLVLFRYVDQFSTIDEENPFVGSLSSIAALRNATGNVVGFMPRIDRADLQVLNLLKSGLK